MIKAGSEQLAELQKQDDLSVSLSEGEDVFDVGDIVGAVDNVTGIAISVPISKKIISIQNDYLSAAYETEIGKIRTNSNGQGISIESANDIAEEGDANNWHYVKRSNGYAECWATMEISGKACNTAVGSWYRTAELKFNPYPFTFAKPPNVNMFFETGSGTGGLVWTAGTASDVTSNTVQPHQFYIIRMASSNAISGLVHVQVKGKWK